MSALLPGGGLMMTRVPSSETKVTPRPGVRPRLPLVMPQLPVSAGLFLQVISAADAAAGKSKMIATRVLCTAHFLQTLSRRFGQEQDGDQRNRNGRQQPLDRGAVGMEVIVQMAFQHQRHGARADFHQIAQARYC